MCRRQYFGIRRGRSPWKIGRRAGRTRRDRMRQRCDWGQQTESKSRPEEESAQCPDRVVRAMSGGLRVECSLGRAGDAGEDLKGRGAQQLDLRQWPAHLRPRHPRVRVVWLGATMAVNSIVVLRYAIHSDNGTIRLRRSTHGLRLGGVGASSTRDAPRVRRRLSARQHTDTHEATMGSGSTRVILAIQVVPRRQMSNETHRND